MDNDLLLYTFNSLNNLKHNETFSLGKDIGMYRQSPIFSSVTKSSLYFFITRTPNFELCG